MTGGGALRRYARALGPPAPLALCLLVLVALGRQAVLEVGVVGLAGIAASELLRRFAARSAGALWIVPAVLAVGVATGLARSTLTAEFFAALAGIALLYWIAAAPSDGTPNLRPSAGLWLPGLSVAVALLVASFLPAGPARLGLAGALLAGALLGAGWAIRSDPARADPQAARS